MNLDHIDINITIKRLYELKSRQNELKLDPWNRTFINDVHERYGRGVQLSMKQVQTINRLYGRVCPEHTGNADHVNKLLDGIKKYRDKQRSN